MYRQMLLEEEACSALREVSREVPYDELRVVSRVCRQRDEAALLGFRAGGEVVMGALLRMSDPEASGAEEGWERKPASRQRTVIVAGVGEGFDVRLPYGHFACEDGLCPHWRVDGCHVHFRTVRDGELLPQALT